MAAELDQLTRVVTATPRGLTRLAAAEHRNELTAGLKAYYDALIAPYEATIRTRIEAERVFRTRSLLRRGVEDMLSGLGPGFRWRSPVLEADHPTVDADLHLGGRGLRLVPSYFCWGSAVVPTDPEIQTERRGACRSTYAQVIPVARARPPQPARRPRPRTRSRR